MNVYHSTVMRLNSIQNRTLHKMLKTIHQSTTKKIYARWNKAINYKYSRMYTFNQDHKILKFDEGALAGQNIIFPLDYNGGAHFELPGYFQKPLLRSGDNVLDLGAFPGDFMVIASRLVGALGKVVGFEPIPENLEYTKEVLYANNIKNVELYPMAAIDADKRVHMSILGEGSAVEEKINGNTVEVQGVRLDSIMKELPVPNVIKADVEGSEVRMLHGAQKLIEQNMPAWIIASYHIVDRQKSHVQLERILGKAGYRVNTTYRKHLTTYAHCAKIVK